MPRKTVSPSTPGHLLTEVKLERFKAAFKPGSIPLRPFNVVIGRNGSGKSTLLEALQWLDATLRRDAREASDRYFGIRDLINLRSKEHYFRVALTWINREEEGLPLNYRIKVEEHGGLPVVAEESLVLGDRPRRKGSQFLKTIEAGVRLFDPSGNSDSEIGITWREPDRLALGLVGATTAESNGSDLAGLRDFWSRAVFLRLSPNRLAQGSPATRRSYEPLLDEEGQNLPALLHELTAKQRENLVEALKGFLSGIRDVEVSKARIGRDTRVNYSLLERMPYRGRSGQSEFPIPAWMLSEGTRRITAILALLSREPAPSLLCIEEVENGLDPGAVIAILNHLVSASGSGTQVIVTTHSPWLLDHVPIDSILQVRRIRGDTRYEHFASRPEVMGFDPSTPAGTRYVSLAE
jgi:predicted ATPase